MGEHSLQYDIYFWEGGVTKMVEQFDTVMKIAHIMECIARLLPLDDLVRVEIARKQFDDTDHYYTVGIMEYRELGLNSRLHRLEVYQDGTFEEYPFPISDEVK